MMGMSHCIREFGLRRVMVAAIQAEKADAGPHSRASIDHWAKLHAVRTAIGTAGTGALLWALH